MKGQKKTKKKGDNDVAEKEKTQKTTRNSQQPHQKPDQKPVQKSDQKPDQEPVQKPAASAQQTHKKSPTNQSPIKQAGMARQPLMQVKNAVSKSDLELPTIKGCIKWFDNKRGFGFIVTQQGPFSILFCFFVFPIVFPIICSNVLSVFDVFLVCFVLFCFGQIPKSVRCLC